MQSVRKSSKGGGGGGGRSGGGGTAAKAVAAYNRQVEIHNKRKRMEREGEQVSVMRESTVSFG